MKTNAPVKAGSLACVIPLSSLATDAFAAVEEKSKRLLLSPIRPVILYTPETLACLGAVPSTIDLALGAVMQDESGSFPFCLALTPKVFIGKRGALPRKPVVAVVHDSIADEGIAAYIDSYATKNLAALGVHLYVFNSIMDQFLYNPLAAVAPLKTRTERSLNIHYNDGFFGTGVKPDNGYGAHPEADVPGGDVYFAHVSTDPYGYGVADVLPLNTGYAVYYSQFRATGDPTPFNVATVERYPRYATVTSPVTGPTGFVRTDVFLSPEKAVEDEVLLTAFAARCGKFRYTFWTQPIPPPAADGSVIPGDPDGVLAALGTGPLVARKELASTAGVRDVAASVADICGDIADFFS